MNSENESESEDQVKFNPGLAKTWADLFSDEEDEETELPISQDISQRGCLERPQDDVLMTSCCFEVTRPTPQNCIQLVKEASKSLNISCAIHMYRNFVNTVCEGFESYNDNERINILDEYMRARHDSLCFLSMASLGLPTQTTDTPFHDVFPIKSKRTPDYILKAGAESYLILEMTAVSDPEKAYKRKGAVERGFSSKYEREITELAILGFRIEYLVLVFDISDIDNIDFQTNLKKAANLMGVEIKNEYIFNLDYLRREHITLTQYMLKYYSKYLNILYGSPYELKTGSDFLSNEIFGEPKNKFTGSYNRVGISNTMFDRVSSAMPRFTVMLDRASRNCDRDTRFELTFEQISSSFHFQKSPLGEKIGKWHLNINNSSVSWVCSKLRVKLRGVLVDVMKADFEFMTYDKHRKKWKLNREATKLHVNASEHRSQSINSEIELRDHSKKLISLKLLERDCKYEDESLEKRLLSSIVEMDVEYSNPKGLHDFVRCLDTKPLCSYVVDDSAFQRAIDNFVKANRECNVQSGNFNMIKHVKPPFQYPIAQISAADYVSYHKKPSILRFLGEMKIGPYTDTIIKVALSENFQFGSTGQEINQNYENAKMELSKAHKAVLVRLKDLYKDRVNELSIAERKNVKFPNMKELNDYQDLSKNFKELNTNLHKTAKENGVENKNIGVINMGTGKKSQSSINFSKEMSHFKEEKTKSHYKGVGDVFDYNYINNLIFSLKGCLLSPADSTCPDKILDGYVADDCKLLKSLKEQSIKNNDEYLLHLINSNIYHSAAFVSRLCHTLMYHSQTSFNSSKIVVDNLGYDNVLIIIKGGKKIFNTKKSKLFRIIYPTFDSCSDLHDKTDYTTNYRSFAREGRRYIISPWVNMHETLVADGITFLHRTMGFALLNKEQDLSNSDNLNRVYFNIILAFHNRRQTEAMLHNLRYIFMNCMSDVSAIEEILPEIAGFNSDLFQYWVRESLSHNFMEFAKKLKIAHDETGGSKMNDIERYCLHHPFNLHKILTLNTLAIGIYSSYLMSKAPVTQSLEQVKNLKGMMKTHEEFLTGPKNVSSCYKELNGSFIEYSNELLDNDFNLDPSYCFLLGKFMGDYLLDMENKSRLILKWDNIVDKPWDEMSNTKGLRGNNDDDFFGNKGYFVVYKEVLSNTTKTAELMNIIQSDEDFSDKSEKIRLINESFRDRIKEKELNQVVFHVVDKVQRGGSREIYVMDLETKVHQQAIEDYTKFLCKLIPNEMISIPSNKRLSHIHTKVFEGSRDEKEKYYWVLDCRKWAPKSVVEKFMIFLMGARHALPETFVVHAMNFFNLMIKKRVYTRPMIYEILTKNKTCEKYKNNFHYDDERKAYYFDMPYSWVMGIFNYFSSLMHVANQMHASHIIRISTHMSYGEDNILHMVAHSDDSAGKIMVSDKYQMLRASFIYEVLMHASNHLLSKKKCNQGRVYYEFLSILYIGGTLLSLLSKFTGMFNYHPTDKGYANDVTDAYSKSTELLLNGATFEQSYIALKIQSYLIYRFYFGNDVPKSSYDYPPSLLGMPDSHPVMSLLCGGDSDLFRIFKTKGSAHKKLLISISKHLIPLHNEYSGMLRSFKCSPKVSMNKKYQSLRESIKVPTDISDSWTMTNVRFNNTYLNACQFVNKLSDKAFLASLQDETLIRRLSRAYYFRSHLSISTSYGDMHPKELKELIHLMKRVVTRDFEGVKPQFKEILMQAAESKDFDVDADQTLIEKSFDFIYFELSMLYNYMSSVHYNPIDVIELKKTCKPVYISIQKTVEECPTNYNPQALTSWIKEPEFRHMLPDTKGFITSYNYVLRTLSDLEISVETLEAGQLCLLLQKMKQRSKSEYFCYSNLPSDLREVSTYQDLLSFIAHNSFQNSYIKGISIQYGKTISVPMEHLNKQLQDDNLMFSLSLITLVIALTNSPDFDQEMLSLDFHRPNFIGGGESSLFDLVVDIISYWEKSISTYKYMKCLCVCALELMSGNKSFDAEKIKNSFLHSYIKRQFLVDNVWLGQGRLFLSLGELKIVVNISNVRINKVFVQTANYQLDEDQVGYFNLCLQSGQLPKIQESMVTTSVEDWGTLGLCYDATGRYFIGDARESLRYIPAQLDINLGTPLSSMEKGNIRSFKGSKMIWSTFDGNDKLSIQLSTLPIEVQNSVSILRGRLLDNSKNKEIMKDRMGDARNILIEVCAKELDLERNINPETMMKNYHLTDLYKIIKRCSQMSLCKSISPELRDTNFPCPDGGLLNVLVSYARFDDSFDFKWQRSVSPEYYSLKTTQPESFVTEFVDTIKEKYDGLYSDIDKSSIHRAINKIAANLNSDDSEKEIMNLLCTWGHTGVSGALNELSGTTDKSHFSKIRNYGQKSPYVKFFEPLYFIVASAISESYKMGLTVDDFIPATEFGCMSKLTQNNCSYMLMSLVHSTVLATYKVNVLDEWVLDINHHNFYCMISSVMTCKKSIERFKEILKDDLILRSLPVNEDSILEWQIAFNTLRSLYIELNNKNLMLDYMIRRPLETELESPYVTTRNILATNGVRVESNRLFHSGAISRYLFDILKTNFYEYHKDAKVWFNVEMVECSTLMENADVVFNHRWFPPKRFTEEFMEDEDAYEEIESELRSSEISIDYIEEVIEGFEGDVYVEEKKKSVLITLNGRLEKVVKFNLKICLLFGGCCNNDIYDKLSMLGDDFILVFNCMPIKLLMCDRFKIYKSRDNAWHGHCIINPETIFYAVFSNDLSDPGFWKRVLNADKIDPTSVNSLRVSNYFDKINASGVKQNADKLQSGDDLWNLITNSMENREAEEAERAEKISQMSIEKDQLVNEPLDDDAKSSELFRKKMADDGMDENQILKYQDVVRNMTSGKGWDDFLLLISNMSSSNDISEVSKQLKSKMEKVIQSPKTSVQHEMIMQVPKILGGGRERGVAKRNTLFKEKKIIAELDSICPNLLWKILSGTLYISDDTKEMFKNQIQLYKMMVAGSKSHKRGKQFIINLCMLIVNDSVKLVPGQSDENVWKDFMKSTLKLILLDENKVNDDEWDFNCEEPETGDLRYGVSGERLGLYSNI